MLKVRDFRPKDFEDVVTCYQTGFPAGHNRYSLSRLVRFQRETILVAIDRDKIVGVIIGITSHREAWLSGMSVLPDPRYQTSGCSLLLMRALGERLVQVGFQEAYTTTGRDSVRRIAHVIGARLIGDEANFYFDGQRRWIFKATTSALTNLNVLLSRRGLNH